MSRSLHSLLKSVGVLIPTGLKDTHIENISCDSRIVKAGDLFIGLPGETVDGGIFWQKALTEGAYAAVISKDAAILKPVAIDDPVVVFPEPFVKLVGELAAEFWGHPSSKMSLIGVTGTNGKTTTTYLIEYLCNAVGKKTALLGTLVNRWPSHNEVAIHTTSFASSLQYQLSEAASEGAEFVAMEVSSHALAQSRVAGCKFSGAIFTNLTQDHLDYHSSMEMYFDAKASLFEASMFRDGLVKSVVNVDDEWGKLLAQKLQKHCWKSTLGLENGESQGAELFFSDLKKTSNGVKGIVHTPIGQGYFVSPLIGDFNLMNFLQAVGVLIQLGLPLEDLLIQISKFKGVPGRMQRIELSNEKKTATLPNVFVDYAHTPDGLKNALTALRPFTKGELICVFGCGGDRDRGKRSKMGAIAGELADKLVVTSDNPRSEDPEKIIEDIKLGISSNVKLFIEVERAKAIESAIYNATKGDVILIAGKGHEDYQIFGKDKIHFDDREKAANALRNTIQL